MHLIVNSIYVYTQFHKYIYKEFNYFNYIYIYINHIYMNCLLLNADV